MGFFNKFKNLFTSNKKEDKQEQEEVQVYDKGLEKSRKEFVSKISLLNLKYRKVSPEYFEELENFDLSDLRGNGYAMCTERSAMAQNVLSLFGFNSYYCLGYMQHNDQVEGHCYNIVQVTNGYRIVDFSVPVLQYNQIHERVLPYFANMSNEDFEQFLTEDFCKKFADYEIEVIDGKSVKHSLPDRVYTNGPLPEISKKL